jgi:response regulator of citrate/malate metabolism
VSGHPRVLVVDDDFAVAALHRSFVEWHGGFTVAGVAHDGGQALQLVESAAPDLVLLDVYLPDMTGLEVLRTLRARPGRQVDVIAITAARELETVRAAMAGGVLDYLVKPFTAQVLRERLDDYLRHREEVRRSEVATEVLDQDQVDRLLAARRRPRATASLPKGLSQATMAAVTRALAAAAAPASAQQVGDAVGISRVSARRYLEHLATSGRARVAPRYGAAGRPENAYELRG